jgi:pimeloyl-ACP methyl ester carboxylesterase
MPETLPLFPTPQSFEEFSSAYQEVLTHWSAPYEEMDIPTRFGETHVIASGPADAPPILFLHAFFATAAVWYPNAGALGQHYRTYAVDVLGEANLSRPTRPITSMDEMAEWFTDLLAGLGIEQTFLVGNSFGAFLSAGFAMHLPERVRGLVMIGPAATFKTMNPFFIHMFLPKMLRMMFPWLPGTDKMIRNGLEWMQAGLPHDNAWDKLFFLCMRDGGATNQLFPRVYKQEELDKIHTPTLLLVGDREKIYDPKTVTRLAQKAIPGIRVEIIPNAHHITALANPTVVNQRIDEFFSSILQDR